MIKSAVEQLESPAQSAGAAPYEGYIDKRECARRLGRTPRSVDTYMARGILPFYKLGRTVAFKWSEVDAHIKAHYRVGVGQV
jgi:predicted DNA-binding transcriptional regulator AlpA